jgi:catechol 2,3-dioxygenase-like lactoylglutathione lyase family enzyme
VRSGHDRTMIDVRRLAWLGTRTGRFAETAAFFRDVLGLRVELERPGQVVLAFPDGGSVEVFSPDEPDHRHFTTGPVAGFLVDDVDTARAELAAAGVELIGPVGRGAAPGEAWQHFRAPDGNVYELTERRR